MLKTLFLILVLSNFSCNSFAESCPLPAEIKINSLHGWQPLNIDSDSPISANRFDLFKRDVKHFALAESMPGANEGEAHCYYWDKTKTDYLGVYLVKAHLVASKSEAWHSSSGDIQQCYASADHCQFSMAFSR